MTDWWRPFLVRAWLLAQLRRYLCPRGPASCWEERELLKAWAVDQDQWPPRHVQCLCAMPQRGKDDA